MATETTHPSLLARVRNPADRLAWQQFDARYGPLVVAYCRSRGLQLSDAEDVRQVVLLSLARGLPTFVYDPARGRFRDYLARIVRNAVSRHLGCHGQRCRVLSNEELDALATAAESDADAEWRRQWAHHHCRLALDALRRGEPARNLAVLDALLAGQAAAAVAAEFGLTAEAVRKIKQRLRERLQALILAQLADEERPHGTRN